MMSINIKSVLLVLLLLMCQCCCCAVTDDWIDPYDMENFDPGSNSMKNKDDSRDKPVTNVKEKDTFSSKETTISSSEPGHSPDKTESGSTNRGNPPSCSQTTSPCVSLFRQYVKSLLYHLRGMVYSGVEDINLRVKVTATEVEYLEKYTDPSSSEHDFHHVHEILSSMVKLASEVHEGDPSVQRLWIEMAIGMPVEKILMFVILAGILILTFVAAAKFHFWKLTVKLVFFLFVISVFWQWYELYKKEEAKQHMAIMKEMPEGCRARERDEGIMSVVLRSLTTTFTFTNDECLQYYEHMLIDPFWRVTPTQALAKTVIRFFVTPMRDIGEAIREFFIGLLKGLPAQLWPVVLAFVGIFSFLLLFMYFGYRVSLPFGLVAIEPGSRGDNQQVRKAIAEQNEELKALKESQMKQMKQIMDAINNENETLRRQLENQGKVLSSPTVSAAVKKILQSGDQNISSHDRPSVETEANIESSMQMIGGGNEVRLSRNILIQTTSSEVCYGADEEGKHSDVDAVQDLSLDEKGTGAGTKSMDTESFEEISVSNIEADTIGHRDN